MFLRLLFVSLLLGASVFVQVKATKTYFGDIQTSHYALIGAIYFLTFVYVILLKYQESLTKLAYIQVLLDTLLVTAIIYTTGGIESIFSFLYILTIINGSILLYRKGGMIVASSSSILYGLLLDLHYYGVLEPFGSRLHYSSEYQSAYIFFMIVVNIAAFYLVAFLSSYATEQAKRSRVELRAKQNDIIKLEALNEWIIRSMTSGLITLDDQGRVILFNPAAEEILGMTGRQAIGRKLGDILPTLRQSLEGRTQRFAHGQRELIPFIDFYYQRPDEKKQFLRCSVSPLTVPEGNYGGQILFLQDLTAMKQIEEEMKKVEDLALIGELAAGIAHEIRNPMASISGSIQILRESLEEDQVSGRLMDIILREINRLNNLVGDFLLFARPKSADIEDFDLNQLIMESLELFKNRREWTGRIRLKTEFQRPLRIKSDPEQIKQILWNLFLNAIEAIEKGGTVYIGTALVDSPDQQGKMQKMARITIRDTGEGLSKKALEHLFTPFFTTKEGGSGLGLATVRRIVEGLKGQVYGKNHPEGGAELTVLLHPNLPPSS